MGKAQRKASAVVKAQREAEARRKRVTIVVSVVAALVVIGGIITWGIVKNNSSAEVVQPKAQTENYGFARGTGPIKVDVYLDFMCPVCNKFEETYGPQLDQGVKEGRITLVTHPVAILNRMSQGTDYSTRSGAASVCAADDAKFPEYAAALFKQQPAENTAGMTNEQLAGIGRTMGLGDTFSTCVTDQTYAGWIDKATEVASEDGLSGTPWTKINGKVVELKDFGTTLDAALAANPSPSAT
ncbi:hypothetical protein Afil01_68300 [Actinorhabdospora filicis]|uniref:Thioredoxin-like fold domain-containing protein n=1 Tax=Actinorhabdospora filicis TaxID=1785913 RepID=A0A9W6STF7_9ACTN|nr:thioredoxin domain-containing protein [Actinorhabdospora filicis]GLZ82023.1 hypothetical protein Afil01_68300 [Actinorhabdospora filicis]